MNDTILAQKWEQILEKLPKDALKKLASLSTEEITQANIYNIIVESGMDLSSIIQ